MTLRKMVALLLCLTMLCALVACGSENEGQKSKNEDTTATTTTSATMGQPIQITVGTQTPSTNHQGSGDTPSNEVKEVFGQLQNGSDFVLHSFYSSDAVSMAASLKYVNFVDEKNLTVSSAYVLYEN